MYLPTPYKDKINKLMLLKVRAISGKWYVLYSLLNIFDTIFLRIETLRKSSEMRARIWG